MKRFTETNKWRDAWFRKLSAPAKLVWIYMTENCDQVGMIELDLKLLSDDCGCKITEGHLAELGDRVQKVCDDRFFIPKFIYFQYGELTPTCAPHRSILKMVEIHKLTRDGILYFHPKGNPVGALEKNHVKRKEAPADPEINSIALAIYDAYPRHIARADALDAIGKALKKISANELLKKTQEYAAARAGQDDHYTPHPATWFNRESYYDDPNAWKSNTPAPTGKPNPRNFGVVGTTDYGDGVKPRLQRELEEKARLAEQMASDGGNPPPDNPGAQPGI